MDGILPSIRRRLTSALAPPTTKFVPLVVDAMRRAFTVAEEYAQICRDLGVERMRFVATSAARDASNREEFFAGVRELLGVEAEIISGDEEARLEDGAAGFLSRLESQRRRLFFTLPDNKAEYPFWGMTAFKFAGDYLLSLIHI